MRLAKNSITVAVIIVAAQLGIGQAIGVLDWRADFTGGRADLWPALLAWVCFIHAVAVLGGAAVGRRSIRRPTRRERLRTRAAAALLAAVGSGGAGVLTLLSSRGAAPPAPVDPQLVIGLAAAGGVLAGVLIAVLALSVSPIGGSLRASAAWVWAAAACCAIAGMLRRRPFDPPRLGVLDAPIAQMPWSDPRLMIAVAFLLGAAVAGLARWGGADRFASAMSGFAGPGLIAIAYLVAGPGSSEVQQQPYHAAMLSVMAGLCGSILVATPTRRPVRSATSVQPAETQADMPDGPQAPSIASEATAQAEPAEQENRSSDVTGVAEPRPATTAGRRPGATPPTSDQAPKRPGSRGPTSGGATNRRKLKRSPRSAVRSAEAEYDSWLKEISQATPVLGTVARAG